MSGANSCNKWVFREGRSSVAGRTVLEGLASALRALGASPNRDALVDALLRSGELECALADAASEDARRVAAMTDAIAAALLDLPGARGALSELAGELTTIATPAVLNLSTPEGFNYYALHPLDFAELAWQAPLSGAQVAVVGIRSIGSTLSAVTAAALARRGLRAQRTTVRPSGHPFDRRTQFSGEQLSWVAWQRARNADFVVVDEGPGISGSSFLSVGDALLEAGVERRRITFLCSRQANPETLIARDAAARWPSFRSLYTAPTRCVPEEAKIYIGGGEWRRRAYDTEAHWPESWTQMERLKFLPAQATRLYKFEGLGRFGKLAAERARLLAEGGFGPRLHEHACGFAEYGVLRGRPMRSSDASATVLDRVADYCAFRALEFAAPAGEPSQLEAMVRFNVREEFGVELNGPATLPVERLVHADGRMLPHEWLATAEGFFKSDGVSHGDDHFFPGPSDIAWDLAGAIVEWELRKEAAQYLLERYRARSGDDARERLAGYLLAYKVFRMAYCDMAAFAVRGSEEEPRLRRACRRYRALVEGAVASSQSSVARAVASRQQPVVSSCEL